MASLRTRSQYIPANKAPVGLPPGPAGGQSSRRIPGPNLLRKDNRKSRVDEKMKQRRMSMRYVAHRWRIPKQAGCPGILTC